MTMKLTPKKKIKVYISSPYTEGDPAANVKVQMEMADRLMDVGYVPFIPLLYHFQHIYYQRGYFEWLEQDLAWVSSCDVLLRLPGKSKGADLEVKEATKLGIPVVYSYSDLTLNHYTE